MSEYANMSPGRAAYLAFCQEIDGRQMSEAEVQRAFDLIGKAAVEANDWLRKHKPEEVIRA